MDFLSKFNNLLALIPFGIGDNLFTIIIFLTVLSILVFVHELGHYSAARSVGVKVEAFSIGFGKELWSRTDKAGTRWKICLIPLGGYVLMKGGELSSKDNKKLEKDMFAAKKVWQRAWVIIAGPLANFVFALFVLCALMLGGEQRPLPEIAKVQADMPAQAAGLQENDIIRMVDDVVVEDWEHVRELISAKPEQPIFMVVERAGEMVPLTITPQKVEHTNIFGETRQVGRIGAMPTGKMFVQKRAFIPAMKRGAERTWDITAGTMKAVSRLITGSISADNLAGPIGIAKMAGETAQHGFYPLLMFMVIISINLGLLNLFPIPVLDGGHLLMLTFEAIFRRPLPEMVQEWMMRIGFSAIILLIGFSTWNDLSRIPVINSAIERVQNNTPATIETPKP